MRNLFKSTLLIIVFLSLIALLLTGCFPKMGSSYIEEIVLAVAVDQNQRTITPSNTFTMDQKVIYLSVKVANVHKETTISTRWILKKGDLAPEGDHTISPARSRYWILMKIRLFCRPLLSQCIGYASV